jgi:hypothetical protein
MTEPCTVHGNNAEDGWLPVDDENIDCDDDTGHDAADVSSVSNLHFDSDGDPPNPFDSDDHDSDAPDSDGQEAFRL